MKIQYQIDTTFDFRSDTPSGKDPDVYSSTLRRYHKLLWSKPLHCGVLFEFSVTLSQAYMHHHSEIGEFWLSSDTVIPSFAREHKIAHIIEQIPEEELAYFQMIGYTIGSMMIFPANRIGRKMTINCERGFHPHIKDRFDLTVECTRRYYHGENSPLGETLERYVDYLNLFQNFRGFMEFSLLQDMVNDDFSTVKFFAPFNEFKTSPIPSTAEAYSANKELAVRFIKARNRRIFECCSKME